MRIILADHHEQARQALRTALAEQAEMDLAGEATNVQDLLTLTEGLNPDLILMDYGFPDEPLEEVIDRLSAFKPIPIVIVMSSELGCCREVLRAGAHAFVSKGDDPAWLVEKLQTYARQARSKEDVKRDKNS